MLVRIINKASWRRVVLFMISILLSFFFLILKDSLIERLDFKVNVEAGQLNKRGLYSVGDYTYQVNRLINHQTLKINNKVMNRYPPIYAFILYGTYVCSEKLGLEFRSAIYILTMLLLALSTIVIGEIAVIIYHSAWLSFISAVLFASHPYIITQVMKAMSETPFILFMLIAVWITIRLIQKQEKILRHTIVIGSSLGIAIMIRPIGLLLPFIFSIMILSFLTSIKFKQRILYVFLILGISEAIMLPWQIYNAQNEEKIIISSNQVYSMKDGFAFNNHPLKQQIDLPAEMDSTARRITQADAKSGKEMFDFIFKEINQNPKVMAKLYGLKLIRCWYAVFTQHPVKEKIKLIIFFIYFSLSLVGYFYHRKYRGNLYKCFLMLFLLLLFYFWGMTLMVVSMARYMYPVFGLAVIFIPGILQNKLHT